MKNPEMSVEFGNAFLTFLNLALEHRAVYFKDLTKPPEVYPLPIVEALERQPGLFIGFMDEDHCYLFEGYVGILVHLGMLRGFIKEGRGRYNKDEVLKALGRQGIFEATEPGQCYRKLKVQGVTYKTVCLPKEDVQALRNLADEDGVCE